MKKKILLTVLIGIAVCGLYVLRDHLLLEQELALDSVAVSQLEDSDMAKHEMMATGNMRGVIWFVFYGFMFVCGYGVKNIWFKE